MKEATEILLNVAQVTHQSSLGESYEFILNSNLAVIECIKITSMKQGIVSSVKDPSHMLEGMLFELNHVRVNPRLNNSTMIDLLTHALSDIGVNVINRPHNNSMAISYKPLGEITDNVRLYIGHNNQIVFLSPAPKKLRVVSIKH